MVILKWRQIAADANSRSLRMLVAHIKGKVLDVASIVSDVSAKKVDLKHSFQIMDYNIRQFGDGQSDTRHWDSVFRRVADNFDEIDRQLIAHERLPRLFVPETAAHCVGFLEALRGAVLAQVPNAEQCEKPKAA